MSWLRIGTSGGNLWTRWWTFWFCKRQDISWLSKRLSTSEEWLLWVRKNLLIFLPCLVYLFNTSNVKVKNVKLSLLQAVEAPRFARGRGSHITYKFDKRLTDGGKVVSLTRRLPFTPRYLFFLRFLVLISVRDCVDSRGIVQPKGLSQFEKCTSSGFDYVTLLLVV
jgi:hypothetical protein